MTNRERQFAALGFHYTASIEQFSMIIVPTTTRVIVKGNEGKWWAQPWSSDSWHEFNDLLEAVKLATPPECKRNIQF